MNIFQAVLVPNLINVTKLYLEVSHDSGANDVYPSIKAAFHAISSVCWFYQIWMPFSKQLDAVHLHSLVHM